MNVLRSQLLSVLRVAVALGAIGAVGAGCGPAQYAVLEFPQNPYLTRSLTRNKVNITVECSRPIEDFRITGDVRRDGEKTVIAFGEGHEIGLRFQVFHVGEARYPTDPGTLFLFLEREGPWTFRFHGQRFVVEHPGRWRPSLYYRSVSSELAADEHEVAGARGYATPRSRVVQPSRQTVRLTQVELEEIHVLEHTIVARAGEDALLINGSDITPDRSARIVLEPGGRVRKEW